MGQEASKGADNTINEDPFRVSSSQDDQLRHISNDPHITLEPSPSVLIPYSVTKQSAEFHNESCSENIRKGSLGSCDEEEKKESDSTISSVYCRTVYCQQTMLSPPSPAHSLKSLLDETDVLSDMHSPSGDDDGSMAARDEQLQFDHPDDETQNENGYSFHSGTDDERGYKSFNEDDLEENFVNDRPDRFESTYIDCSDSEDVFEDAAAHAHVTAFLLESANENSDSEKSNKNIDTLETPVQVELSNSSHDHSSTLPTATEYIDDKNDGSEHDDATFSVKTEHTARSLVQPISFETVKSTDTVFEDATDSVLSQESGILTPADGIVGGRNDSNNIGDHHDVNVGRAVNTNTEVQSEYTNGVGGQTKSMMSDTTTHLGFSNKQIVDESDCDSIKADFPELADQQFDQNEGKCNELTDLLDLEEHKSDGFMNNKNQPVAYEAAHKPIIAKVQKAYSTHGVVYDNAVPRSATSLSDGTNHNLIASPMSLPPRDVLVIAKIDQDEEQAQGKKTTAQGPSLSADCNSDSDNSETVIKAQDNYFVETDNSTLELDQQTSPTTVSKNAAITIFSQVSGEAMLTTTDSVIVECDDVSQNVDNYCLVRVHNQVDPKDLAKEYCQAYERLTMLDRSDMESIPHCSNEQNEVDYNYREDSVCEADEDDNQVTILSKASIEFTSSSELEPNCFGCSSMADTLDVKQFKPNEVTVDEAAYSISDTIDECAAVTSPFTSSIIESDHNQATTVMNLVTSPMAVRSGLDGQQMQNSNEKHLFPVACNVGVADPVDFDTSHESSHFSIDRNSLKIDQQSRHNRLKATDTDDEAFSAQSQMSNGLILVTEGANKDYSVVFKHGEDLRDRVINQELCSVISDKDEMFEEHKCVTLSSSFRKPVSQDKQIMVECNNCDHSLSFIGVVHQQPEPFVEKSETRGLADMNKYEPKLLEFDSHQPIASTGNINKENAESFSPQEIGSVSLFVEEIEDCSNVTKNLDAQDNCDINEIMSLDPIDASKLLKSHWCSLTSNYSPNVASAHCHNEHYVVECDDKFGAVFDNDNQQPHLLKLETEFRCSHDLEKQKIVILPPFCAHNDEWPVLIEAENTVAHPTTLKTIETGHGQSNHCTFLPSQNVATSPTATHDQSNKQLYAGRPSAQSSSAESGFDVPILTNDETVQSVVDIDTVAQDHQPQLLAELHDGSPQLLTFMATRLDAPVETNSSFLVDKMLSNHFSADSNTIQMSKDLTVNSINKEGRTVLLSQPSFLGELIIAVEKRSVSLTKSNEGVNKQKSIVFDGNTAYNGGGEIDICDLRSAHVSEPSVGLSSDIRVANKFLPMLSSSEHDSQNYAGITNNSKVNQGECASLMGTMSSEDVVSCLLEPPSPPASAVAAPLWRSLMTNDEDDTLLTPSQRRRRKMFRKRQLQNFVKKYKDDANVPSIVAKDGISMSTMELGTSPEYEQKHVQQKNRNLTIASAIADSTLHNVDNVTKDGIKSSCDDQDVNDTANVFSSISLPALDAATVVTQCVSSQLSDELVDFNVSSGTLSAETDALITMSVNSSMRCFNDNQVNRNVKSAAFPLAHAAVTNISQAHADSDFSNDCHSPKDVNQMFCKNQNESSSLTTSEKLAPCISEISIAPDVEQNHDLVISIDNEGVSNSDSITEFIVKKDIESRMESNINLTQSMFDKSDAFRAKQYSTKQNSLQMQDDSNNLTRVSDLCCIVGIDADDSMVSCRQNGTVMLSNHVQDSSRESAIDCTFLSSNNNVASRARDSALVEMFNSSSVSAIGSGQVGLSSPTINHLHYGAQAASLAESLESSNVTSNSKLRNQITSSQQSTKIINTAMEVTHLKSATDDSKTYVNKATNEFENAVVEQNVLSDNDGTSFSSKRFAETELSANCDKELGCQTESILKNSIDLNGDIDVSNHSDELFPSIEAADEQKSLKSLHLDMRACSDKYSLDEVPYSDLHLSETKPSLLVISEDTIQQNPTPYGTDLVAELFKVIERRNSLVAQNSLRREKHLDDQTTLLQVPPYEVTIANTTIQHLCVPELLSTLDLKVQNDTVATGAPTFADCVENFPNQTNTPEARRLNCRVDNFVSNDNSLSDLVIVPQPSDELEEKADCVMVPIHPSITEEFYKKKLTEGTVPALFGENSASIAVTDTMVENERLDLDTGQLLAKDINKKLSAKENLETGFSYAASGYDFETKMTEVRNYIGPCSMALNGSQKKRVGESKVITSSFFSQNIPNATNAEKGSEGYVDVNQTPIDTRISVISESRVSQVSYDLMPQTCKAIANEDNENSSPINLVGDVSPRLLTKHDSGLESTTDFELSALSQSKLRQSDTNEVRIVPVSDGNASTALNDASRQVCTKLLSNAQACEAATQMIFQQELQKPSSDFQNLSTSPEVFSRIQHEHTDIFASSDKNLAHVYRNILDLNETKEILESNNQILCKTTDVINTNAASNCTLRISGDVTSYEISRVDNKETVPNPDLETSKIVKLDDINENLKAIEVLNPFREELVSNPAPSDASKRVDFRNDLSKNEMSDLVEDYNADVFGASKAANISLKQAPNSPLRKCAESFSDSFHHSAEYVDKNLSSSPYNARCMSTTIRDPVFSYNAEEKSLLHVASSFAHHRAVNNEVPFVVNCDQNFSRKGNIDTYFGQDLPKEVHDGCVALPNLRGLQGKASESSSFQVQQNCEVGCQRPDSQCADHSELASTSKFLNLTLSNESPPRDRDTIGQFSNTYTAGQSSRARNSHSPSHSPQSLRRMRDPRSHAIPMPPPIEPNRKKLGRYSFTSPTKTNKPKRIADIVRRELCSSDPSRVQAGLQQLSELALTEAATIARTGGLLAIVQCMEFNIDCTEIQIAACKALEKLALDHDNEIAIAEVGGMEAILDSMMAHFENGDVHEAAWSALWNLTCHTGSTETTLDEHESIDDIPSGMEVLVSCMMEHAERALVQSNACGTLANLCQSPERFKAMRKAGGLVAIAKALEKHWDNTDVRQEASHALLSLLEPQTHNYNEQGGFNTIEEASTIVESEYEDLELNES